MTIDEMDIAKVAERLRATTKEDREEGRFWGIQWAAHDATLSQLREVADLVAEEAVNGEALVAIDPELPDSLNGGDDRDVSRKLAQGAFVTGFAEGAIGVLSKVEKADPSISDA